MAWEELINPDPLDQPLIDGLMTKRPRLHWYEVTAFLRWRRAHRRWRRDLKRRGSRP